MSNTNLDVARAWVSGSGKPMASGNGNLSHNGNGTLFSYSTPIANIVRNAHGRYVALVTSDRYSITTEGKHKGAAHKALIYGMALPTFHVPCLMIGKIGGYSRSLGRYSEPATPAEWHAANLASYAERIERERARLKRARTFKSTEWLDRIISERADYVAAFGVVAPLDVALKPGEVVGSVAA